MPIQYYYDRDKLITEISPFYRLDFLYDEYDELYGLIFNETKKYFYIKESSSKYIRNCGHRWYSCGKIFL